MAIALITKRSVDACQWNGQQVPLWDRDVKGFGLRVSSGGVKSYIFQYRMGGRGNPTRRYTIGRHGAFTPEQARVRAKELARLVAQGHDPLELEREEREGKAQAVIAAEADAQRRHELLFENYVERFLDIGTKTAVRDRTLQGYQGALANHATPVLGKKALPEITRADIAKVLDRIPRDQQSVRRMTFAVMRMVFNWAKSRGDLTTSPLDGMRAPASPASRDRVLTDEELALALRVAAATDKPFGPFFELVFATGQRREEVAGISWSELNRSEALWTLPRERSKNGEAHIVPLNSMAMDVLDRMADQVNAKEPKWPRRGLVFTTTSATPISGFSRAKARFDADMLDLARQEAEKLGEDPEAVKLAPWRLHDARRTLATALQRLGVRFEVTVGSSQPYRRSQPLGRRCGLPAARLGPEKRAALDAWAEYCRKLLSPPSDTTNVVPFPEATGSPA